MTQLDESSGKDNISDGGVTIKSHMSASSDDGRKFGMRNMQIMRRLDVDILGDNYPWE